MHNTPEPFTQASVFSFLEAVLLVFAAILAAAFVYANLPLILWALNQIFTAH